jgi:hypothetical protein
MKKNYILIGICGILALSSILITVETATSGMEMSRLETKEAELIDQKRSFEASLVKSLSNAELQEKAESLGFVKPIDLVYITQESSVAKLP